MCSTLIGSQVAKSGCKNERSSHFDLSIFGHGDDNAIHGSSKDGELDLMNKKRLKNDGSPLHSGATRGRMIIISVLKGCRTVEQSQSYWKQSRRLL